MSREVLLEMKKEHLENTRKRVESRTLYGQLVEVEIKGEIHRMRRYDSGKAKAPVYFDIHGGGFCWGMMEEGDLFCQRICERLGFQVYALDYPLTPDVRYPSALYWLYDTIHYMVNHAEEFCIDPEQMLVGGRSAGGNLSAALCLLAKQRKEFQFACQVLDHPYLDVCGIIPDEERYLGPEALTMDLMELLASSYASMEERKESLCSPLNASDEELRGLPPAVIQTCELDSLRPDGDRYAKRLQENDVKVIAHCYPKVPHGFTEEGGPEEDNGQQWLLDGMQKMLIY